MEKRIHLFILSIDINQMPRLLWTRPRLLKAEHCAWHICLPWARKVARDKTCAVLPLPQFLSFSLSRFKYFPCFRPHPNLQPPRTHRLPWLLLNWKSPKCEISPCPSCLTDTPPHVSATAEPTAPSEFHIANHEALVHFLPNATCDDPATSSSSSYNWHELPSGPWLSGVCTLPTFPLNAAFTRFFINAFLDAMMAL